MGMAKEDDFVRACLVRAVDVQNVVLHAYFHAVQQLFLAFESDTVFLALQEVDSCVSVQFHAIEAGDSHCLLDGRAVVGLLHDAGTEQQRAGCDGQSGSDGLGGWFLHKNVLLSFILVYLM